MAGQTEVAVVIDVAAAASGPPVGITLCHNTFLGNFVVQAREACTSNVTLVT
jgi:hypothetical protein